jgi:hypothetical protein
MLAPADAGLGERGGAVAGALVQLSVGQLPVVGDDRGVAGALPRCCG